MLSKKVPAPRWGRHLFGLGDQRQALAGSSSFLELDTQLAIGI